MKGRYKPEIQFGFYCLFNKELVAPNVPAKVLVKRHHNTLTYADTDFVLLKLYRDGFFCPLLGFS